MIHRSVTSCMSTLHPLCAGALEGVELTAGAQLEPEAHGVWRPVIAAYSSCHRTDK